MSEEEQSRSGLEWQLWVENNRWSILLGLVGLGLVGLGFRYWQSPKSDYRVEILPVQETATSSAKLVVDMAGAVNKPGIYELPYGARVSEALMAAGGLAEDADQVWVEQVINKAERVRDGQKIYILSTEEHETIKPLNQKVNDYGEIAGMSTSSTVSINSASQAELEALWGIGPATAIAIIESRPYGSVEELLSKKLIKQNVWERNKEKLSL